MYKKNNILVVTALILGLISLGLARFKQFGPAAAFFTGIITLLGYSYTNVNVDKSIRSNFRLSQNNRAIDLYVNDLRQIINLEKEILIPELMSVGKNGNITNFNRLYDLITDSKQSQVLMGDKQITTFPKNHQNVNYLIYNLPLIQKTEFKKHIDDINHNLEELAELNPNTPDFKFKVEMRTKLDDIAVLYIENHEKILEQAKKELDKYNVISEELFERGK